MSAFGFGLFCLFGFTLPVPLLPWLAAGVGTADVRRALCGGARDQGERTARADLGFTPRFLDVPFGIFVMLGIEKVTMTPRVGQGFSLDFIDWSHSLAMSLVWAVLFSVPFWRRGSAVGAAVGFAVFSHYLLDLPMHPPDMALWPHSPVHLGLWLRLPTGWWWVELAVIAVLCAYYVARARASTTFGGRAIWLVR